MTSKAFDFIRGVLGAEGAIALKKAAERSPLLDAALLPRTVWTWLQIVDGMGGSFEGGLPGCSNSYICLNKSENGYAGVIGIDGQESYSFDRESLQHVAAGVVVALGADADHVDPALALVDLQRLGKSIDILAKSKLISRTLLQKSIRVCTECGHGASSKHSHPPDFGCEVAGCKCPGLSTEKAEPPGQAAAPTAPQQQATPMQPAKQPQAQGTAVGTGKGTASNKAAKPGGAFGKSIKLPLEAISKAECRLCQEKLFRGEEFHGCLCFEDLRKSVSTVRDGQALVVNFGRGWDNEALMTLMETLRTTKQS